MADDYFGVRINGGVAPFQIVQQDAEGHGTMSFNGQWQHEENQVFVQLRIVREDDGCVVSPETNWQDASEQDGSEWSHTFHRVPSGGLYSLQTRLVIDRDNAEWSPHGDSVHHIGVGDLWIIAGQSNAAGYGRGPAHDPPALGVHILKNNETWDIAAHPLNDTTRSAHPNLENANPGHAPYLRFAKDLKNTLGYPIGLVQTALGGSSLAMWNIHDDPNAPLYHNMLHCIQLAGGHVRGMVWYQGESDCGITLAPTYEKRFADFINQVRTDLAMPDLPVIIAQLNRHTDEKDDEGHRGWSIIREAQRQARSLGHLAVVSTLDLPISDGIHTSSDGNLTLGGRKSRAALGMVYNHPEDYLCPDVSEGILVNNDQAIELTFTDVTNRLMFLGPGERDFAVEDAEDYVLITSATCVGRDRVRLELERPVSKPVKVHGAFGANPPSQLRDAETSLPMLGFYNFIISD